MKLVSFGIPVLAIEQLGLGMQGHVRLLGVLYRDTGASALGFRFLATTQGIECVGQVLPHQRFKSSGSTTFNLREDRAKLRLSLRVTLADLVGSRQQEPGEYLGTGGERRVDHQPQQSALALGIATSKPQRLSRHDNEPDPLRDEQAQHDQEESPEHP